MDKQLQMLLEKAQSYAAERGQICSAAENEPMSRHTTFRIGGAADLYFEPHSEEELLFLLRTSKELGIRTLILGRGSNLLFDDAGFRGAVLSTASMRAIRVAGSVLTAEAGASLRSCANEALEHSLTGLEFAHGIPASCGGAVFMNAGAYDGEIAHVLSSSRYYDTLTDEIITLDNADHTFGYRESVYRKHPERVILSAEFRLNAGDPDAIRAKMDDLMRRRIEKQPLEYPSAGSTFKRYPGRFTAQMIDEAGLKGYTIGGAQVSEKHAGFVINRGNATAADVHRLIDHIRAELQKKFGVIIETEVISVSEK